MKDFLAPLEVRTKGAAVASGALLLTGLVGKGDFSGFLSFGGFGGIFGKL